MTDGRAGRRRVVAVACAALAGALIAGCRGSNPEMAIALYAGDGGDAGRGRAAIQQYGCGSCHTIPGVAGANGLVGPPLLWFARQSYVAGELPNTPDNVELWIRSPQKIHPRTAMPALGLNDQQARDVVAYLYTLR